jgi:hypothetical protein
MTQASRHPRPRALALPLLWLLAAPSLAFAEEEGPTNEDCMSCHTDPTTTRADGKPVLVDDEKWKGSIHGELATSCTDCHADLAGAEMPHAESLKPAQCVSCHEKAVPAYEKGIHRLIRDDGKGPNASCAGCHGDAHAILASGDRRAPTHHLNLVATCAECHDDPKLKATGKMLDGVVKNFTDSIHGRAISEAGLVVAPTCATCHGFHDVRKKDDPKNPVSRANQAATCGKCHLGIHEKYGDSIHATELAKGNKDAPICSDCHSAHSIRSSDATSWKLDVISECGTCHKESLRTYRDTFHGHVTELGFTRMAKCADCHGAHNIVSGDDPRSPVKGDNRVAMCATCHPGATPSFVQYDPHADASNRLRSAPLYYTSMLMKGLLVGVFGFFGLHTLLWLIRGLVDKARGRGHGPRGEG